MRPLVLTALVVALLAAPARAELVNQAPATFVYADALLREAVVEADKRWHRRGYVPCAGEVFVYDEHERPPDPRDRPVARGEINGCNVFFDRRYRDLVWARYTNVRIDRIARRSVLAGLCSSATHERGHNLGFEHKAGGVMLAPPLRAPWQCKRWAAWKLPRFGPVR